MLRAILACFATISFAAAADVKVDNPAYDSWAKEKVGTVLSFTETEHLGAKKLEGTREHTLKSIKPDEVRVESRYFSGGVETKDYRTEYPVFKSKMIPDKAGKDAAMAPDSKCTAAGTEKLKIGAKTFETKKFKKAEKVFGADTITTYWLSTEVPGLRVKEETEEKIGGKFQKTKTLLFKEVKAP
jgi:hypothetical protein